MNKQLIACCGSAIAVAYVLGFDPNIGDIWGILGVFGGTWLSAALWIHMAFWVNTRFYFAREPSWIVFASVGFLLGVSAIYGTSGVLAVDLSEPPRWRALVALGFRGVCGGTWYGLLSSAGGPGRDSERRLLQIVEGDRPTETGQQLPGKWMSAIMDKRLIACSVSAVMTVYVLAIVPEVAPGIGDIGGILAAVIGMWLSAVLWSRIALWVKTHLYGSREPGWGAFAVIGIPLGFCAIYGTGAPLRFVYLDPSYLEGLRWLAAIGVCGGTWYGLLCSMGGSWNQR